MSEWKDMKQEYVFTVNRPGLEVKKFDGFHLNNT